MTNPAEEDPTPFDDTHEICHELERLSQKYEMTPGDDYYIQEAKVTLLAMQVSLSVMQKQLKKQ